MVGSSICGARWMRTATSSTSWCSRGGIGAPRLRFFRKLLTRQGCVPRRLITPQYPAACRTDAVGGPLYGSVCEQPCRGVASTDAPAGAPDAALQVGGPSATLRHGPRGGAESVSGRAAICCVRRINRLLRTRAFVEWEAVTVPAETEGGGQTRLSRNVLALDHVDSASRMVPDAHCRR